MFVNAVVDIENGGQTLKVCEIEDPSVQYSTRKWITLEIVGIIASQENPKLPIRSEKVSKLQNFGQPVTQN